MSKHWLTLLLLAVLVVLVALAWPKSHGGGSTARMEREEPLPPPIPERLFEDFSEVADEPPARLLPSPPPRHKKRDKVAGRGEQRGKIALIIDDVGYDLDVERRLLALPFPLAISVLPNATHPKRAAMLAHQGKRVVMLHLPMEPSNPALRRHLGSSFLRLGMTDAELRRRFDDALAEVPFVQGVNNHMGSLLTADHHAMQVVMARCRSHHLFFVDSRTKATSVAADEAKKAGLRWAQRQVFLDHVDDATAIAKAWRHAVALARKRGSCVVIGHPRRKTVAFLASLDRSQVGNLVPITEVLQ